MNEITIKLPTRQAVAVMMAVNERMNTAKNLRAAYANSGESKERLEILDNEAQLLAEAYQNIQGAL